MESSKGACAVIPAFNEEGNVGEVVGDARKYVDCVVVIDDGSEDKTGKVAKKNGAVVLKHMVNLGKGAALKTGCEFAILSGYDPIITLDADGQHDCHEIPKFLVALKRCEVVFGSRRLDEKMPFLPRVGNRLFSFFMRVLFGIRVSDVQSGYKGFWARAYDKLIWEEGSYAVENEIAAKVARHKLSYFEIVVNTKYGDKYKGMGLINQLKILVKIFKMRLFGFR